MHHGNNQNVINLNRVQQRVWEHLGQATPNVCLEDAPTVRRLHNLPDGCLDTPDEP